MDVIQTREAGAHPRIPYVRGGTGGAGAAPNGCPGKIACSRISQLAMEYSSLCLQIRPSAVTADAGRKAARVKYEEQKREGEQHRNAARARHPERCTRYVASATVKKPSSRCRPANQSVRVHRLLAGDLEYSQHLSNYPANDSASQPLLPLILTESSVAEIRRQLLPHHTSGSSPKAPPFLDAILVSTEPTATLVPTARC